MKRLILTAVASCALLAACGKKQAANATSATPQTLVSSNANPVPAAPTPVPTGKFEGEIIVDVKTVAARKLPASVTFDIRGDKVRYEPAPASVCAVDDLDGQHAYVISDAKKAYADVDTKAPANKDKAPPSVRLERSTKTEKVAGMECEDWTIDDGIEKADVCAAKGIAFFDPASDPKAGYAEPSWARAMTTQKAFPLRVVVHDRSGKEQYSAQAFEVRWKQIDEATFQVPAGFKKADLTSDLKVASLP